jgi:hypothetical protein
MPLRIRHKKPARQGDEAHLQPYGHMNDLRPRTREQYRIFSPRLTPHPGTKDGENSFSSLRVFVK